MNDFIICLKNINSIINAELITAADLKRSCGLCPNHYTYIQKLDTKRFNPTAKSLEKLASALGVRVFDLYNPDFKYVPSHKKLQQTEHRLDSSYHEQNDIVQNQEDLPKGYVYITIVANVVQLDDLKFLHKLNLNKISRLKPSNPIG